jgi:transcriptional regulator with XRE-family HTH domain
VRNATGSDEEVLISPGQIGLWGLVEVPAASDLLRSSRLIRGWSQAKLAQALGISQPSLSRMETGAFVIDLDVALRAARVLDMPLDDLVGATDETVRRHTAGRRQGNWNQSRALACRLQPAQVSEFVKRGGSARALRAAREGRQPLPLGQARLLLELLPVVAKSR